MNSIVLWLNDLRAQIGIRDVIDIAIVTFGIYQLLKFTKQTRANQVLKGIAVVIVIAQLSNWIGFVALSWVFNYILEASAVVLVILFQPELRRALEKIGRGKLLLRLSGDEHDELEEGNEYVNELVRAVQRMSGHHTGALIVIQNLEPLGDIIESGTQLYARVSAPLIENIFTPNTPLHDGAIVINDNLIVAAGCFLPMSANPYLEQEMGTRHRAALGLSENTDAIIIVVSEETGVVSIARGGKLTRYIDGNALRKILEELHSNEQRKKGLSSLLWWRRQE